MRFPLPTVFVILSVCASIVLGASHAQSRMDEPRRDPVADFEAGQNAHERGDYTSAVRYYTAVVEARPDLFQAYYQRAVSLTALGRIGEAEADLRRTIQLKPDFARAYRSLGLVLLDRGATEEACDEFKKALDLDPTLQGVRLYYGSALIKRGDPTAAAAMLEAARQRGEKEPQLYALLGLAHERLGSTEQALAGYSRALEVDADNITAREGRARLYAKSGELQRAIDEYTLAYRVQPSTELALLLADLHMRAGQSQLAVGIYRSLLAEKPGDLAVRERMAGAMVEAGLLDEARKEIDTLIAARPRDAGTLLLAGDMVKDYDPEAAAGYYSRALEIEPANNRARVELGAALLQGKQYDRAVQLLAEAVRSEPENYTARANLATAFFKLKIYPDAAREFIWLIQRNPELPASYFFLGICFDRLGDCGQALRAYSEFTRRARSAEFKNELDEAAIRIGMLQKLEKEGKCKTSAKKKK